VHIVTKILVVIGAVLSLLLSALTIAFSANADSIRSAYASEQANRIAAQQNANAANALAGQQNASLQAAKEAAELKAADLDRQIKDLQNERATLLASVEAARFGDQSLKNQVDSLTAQAQANAAIIKALNEEAGKLRTEQVVAARRETELVDRLNDLESQRQVLEQNTRALQEQLAEARLTAEQARSGGTSASGESLGTSFTSTGPLVQSRVVSLTKSPTGDELVELDQGSAVGLRVGQKLSIVRDGRFVASVTLTTLDLQRSVGRLDRLGRQVDVRGGDLVLSRLQ
jgi:hypothetical protein